MVITTWRECRNTVWSLACFYAISNFVFRAWQMQSLWMNCHCMEKSV